MFAGKTAELLRRVAAAHDQGRAVTVYKPETDNRYDALALVTHDGRRLTASPITLDCAGLVLPPPGALLVIDEAHFFGNALLAPVRSALATGVDVLLAGVDLDHRGLPFDPFPTLLCEADEVVKLRARCARCGGPAVHSHRLAPGSDRVLVGGAEAYEPRCRACFPR